MAKICPRCGATSGEKRFAGFFCEDCCAEKIGVCVEGPVELEACKRCGKMRAGKEWVPMSRANVEARLRRAAKGKFENVRFVMPDSCEGEGRAVFVVSAGGSFIEAVRPFLLRKRETICADCSRSSSGYFESIVQVRCRDAARAARLAEKIRRALSKSTFVAKSEESRHGIDLYAGSNKATMAALERLGLAAEKSAKLHGLKDGQRIYRTTYCVRC
ncbi:MAG: NMD3-related protein [Candidatus ainarchaeum sp.]|nr:NMD3-related protein [Candidatus ainarchaeum sp.]